MTDSLQILLIEDSDDDAEMTQRALIRNKVANRIERATDGPAALEFLAKGPLPKLILLDLKLPRMNGLEVLRAIRESPRTRLIPVVVLSSSREEPDIAAAYALGVNSYIVKPVEFDAFIKAVSEAGLYWMLLNEPPRVNP